MSGQEKIQKYVEKVTAVAILVASLLVIYVCAWVYLRGGTEPRISSGLQKGSVLFSPPNVSYGQSSQTLLIAMKTDCGSCQDSVPFYQQLARERSAHPGGARVIAVFPDTEDEVKEFVRRNELDLATVASTDFGPLKITGTPTIVLVDDGGKIRDFWLGKLSKDAEQQVISAVGAKPR
jgi:thiol-disulfide isomerase/thioredoxin